MKIRTVFLSAIVPIVFTACSGDDKLSDGYGSFEADECMLSSEVAGKIIFFSAGEGEIADSGKTLVIIDTVATDLKKRQLESQKKAIGSKVSGIVAQLAVMQKQKDQIENEIKRVEKLVEAQSVPSKQLDDLRNQLEVLKKQMDQVRTQNEPVLYEMESLEYQIKQLEDQISKCYIKAPFKGTIVEKYSEDHEYVSPGKSVCKLAGMQDMYLRAYISETSLASVKTGTVVKVMFDEGENISEIPGTVTWVSPEAEFTPKTIQTREERTGLVYAVKIKVKNDGRIKIGMPGEFILNVQ